LYRLIEEYNPQTVIVDPISSLVSVGSFNEVRDMLIRLIDVLKTNRINAFFTSLTHQVRTEQDHTVDAVSSLADIWMKLDNEPGNNNYERTLRIVKARGMEHETTTQNFIITPKGIQLFNGENKTQKRKQVS
jgi:circadian clock protein KaiC